jgi:hypothetical protein
MHRMPRHLTVALALFALLGAQVFGLQRGYVCLCSGEAVETPASHCDDEAEGCGHEHEGTSPDHAPLTVKHEAQGKASSTPLVQAPVLIAILDFKDIIALSIFQTSAETAMSRPPPGKGVNPPASLLVAECTVLLI